MDLQTKGISFSDFSTVMDIRAYLELLILRSEEKLIKKEV
jgi:hypothetical protein